jgi:DedD protein
MAWFKFGNKDKDRVMSTRNVPAESAEAMRKRALHRLIGSGVLVLAAVVGFPMLFDSQPRPVVVDMPIEIPDKAKVKPLPMPSGASQPSARAPAARVDDTASLSGQEEIVSTSPAASTPKPPKPSTAAVVAGAAAVAAGTAAIIASTGKDDAQKAADKAAEKVAEKAKADKAAADKLAADKAKKLAADKAAAANSTAADTTASDKTAADKAAADKAEKAAAAKAKADKDKADKIKADKDKAALEASRAKALLDGKPADTKPAAKPASAAEAAGTRYIVQFGAFTDVAKSREVRQKVEKAGLKTYSQVAKNAEGNDLIRVRVGPFASKAEADKAAAKIKALDLPASILTL